jgi:mRNA interferase MazF
LKTGDIILIPFPFAELTQLKARPAIVIAETADKYHDIIVAAVSSVIPATLTKNEFIITPAIENGLRVNSVVKADRIVTAKAESIIAKLGKLSAKDCTKFIEILILSRLNKRKPE